MPNKEHSVGWRILYMSVFYDCWVLAVGCYSQCQYDDRVVI